MTAATYRKSGKRLPKGVKRAEGEQSHPFDAPMGYNPEGSRPFYGNPRRLARDRWGNLRFIRRRKDGTYMDNVDFGRSIQTDRRMKAKTWAPSGFRDQGDGSLGLLTSLMGAEDVQQKKAKKVIESAMKKYDEYVADKEAYDDDDIISFGEWFDWHLGDDELQGDEETLEYLKTLPPYNSPNSNDWIWKMYHGAETFEASRRSGSDASEGHRFGLLPILLRGLRQQWRDVLRFGWMRLRKWIGHEGSPGFHPFRVDR